MSVPGERPDIATDRLRPELRTDDAQRAHRIGRTPAAAVRREEWRALGALALMPARAAGYLVARSSLRAEIARDLEHPAPIAREPEIAPLSERSLRIFIACAEASGEVHARSLVAAVRARLVQLGAREAEFVGLGGARLEAAGVRLLGRPVERASMGFQGVLGNLSYYTDLLRAAAQELCTRRIDVCVPVDSPALHVPLAHIAHGYRVPVVHFVTPQYWGWAPWRVGSYRVAVDRALTILPFEPAWFARQGVDVAHVGHPLLDALAHVPSTRPRDDARELVILSGSRSGVIERNLEWMLHAAKTLRERAGDIPIVVAHEDRALDTRLCDAVERAGAGSFARVETGDLHASLGRARAALSVSGTVLIDLLHHRLPAVVIYRLAKRREAWLARHLLTVPWFSSVNLLAARTVYPEFCFHGEGPLRAIVDALERCYGDARERAHCAEGLELASLRLGPPGAADRAAAQILAIAAEDHDRVGRAR